MQVYMLGGRAYGSAATLTTIAQDGYLMGVVRKHGLADTVDTNGDLLGAVLDAGCAAALVSGLLTEDRKPWTRDEAFRNAAFFDGLTDPESKTAFYDALAVLLSDFFSHGGSSSRASPTSSTRRPRRKTQGRGNPVPPLAPSLTSAVASGPDSSPTSPSDAPSA